MKIITIGLTILSGLILTACGNNNRQVATKQSHTHIDLTSTSISKRNDQHKHSSISTESKSQSETVSTNPQVTTSSQTSSTAEIVFKHLVGHSYAIFPILFDGEDVGTAMDSGKAPSNTVHDNGTYLYFINQSTVHETGSMSTTMAWSETYRIVDNHLIIGSHFRIPFTIKNNTVVFDTWNVKFHGHNYTYEIKSDPSAKERITSKELQN